MALTVISGVDALRTRTAEALAEGRRVVTSRLTLAEVVPALSTLLLRLAARPGEPVLDVACWQLRPEEMALLVEVFPIAYRHGFDAESRQTLGRHVRPILDHYQALLNGIGAACIDAIHNIQRYCLHAGPDVQSNHPATERLVSQPI